MEQETLYRFGPFCLDTKERVLLRDGRFVPLAPKALSTLLVLVRNKGHVVEKDVLMSEVWPDEFVEEGNLTQHIFMVRRALGETTEAPGYIETIPRRGYRFLESLSNDSSSTIPPVNLPRGKAGQESLRKNISPDTSVAYNHYLKGRFYWNKRSQGALTKSIECFNQAISLDPDYALAHAGLADSYNMMGFYCMLSPNDAFPKARNAATTALAIEPALAEAHASLGFATLLHDWDWDGAEQLFRESIELNPNYITAYLTYGCHLISAGRFQEAIECYQRAREIDPLSLIANAALGYGYYFARRYDQAIEQCNVALELDEHFEVAHVWLGWAYEQKGMCDEAILGYQKAMSLSGGRTGIAAAMGTAYALGGKRKRAQKVLEELSELAKQRYVSPYRIACIYAALGDTDKAFEYLEKAYKGRSHLLVNLRIDPKLDSLRADPRLTNLAERIVPAKHYLDGGEAYLLFLKGRYCWSSHTREGLEQAIKYFRQAIELDPNYVLAYSAIVDCYLRLTTNYFLPAASAEQTIPAAHITAIQDIPLRIQASLKLRDQWDWATNEREMKRAVELKYNYPMAHQWHAAYLFARSLYRAAAARSINLTETGREDLSTVPMNSRDNTSSTSLTAAEEIQIFCVIAREQVEAGNMEGASLALQRWYKVGEWPRLDGLGPQSCADLLFTTGLVVGRLLSNRQFPRGQKHAAELLNGAIGIYEQLGLKTRSAEGRFELGMCYHREGAFDLAKTTLLAALDEPEDNEFRCIGFMRMAFVDQQAGHLRDAMLRLNQASELALSAGPWTSAYYHNALATTLKEIAIAELRDDYFDRAYEHFQLALTQYEAVGHHQCVAVMQNNFGYLLVTLNKLDDAEGHLLIARQFFDHLSDRVRRAQVDETLSQLHLAANRLDLAEESIIRSLAMLQTGGEEALLAESLRTHGRILCKFGRRREAKRALDRAHQVAERCGDMEGAGMALLIMIEEIYDQLEPEELLELGVNLCRLLGDSQRTSLLDRLQKCLEVIASRSREEAKARKT